ncbi:uncharacterized protein LOC127862258 isoform X2 [Dreissena polymorpha]|uniref:ZP domain-containing protein n=2 Tax=Dreissena polymorpha TaxID=45954 RepID=A0A9D3YCP6_DREPO|nr:uncharacterized protein LOC127862258 isoform X2 [Dreissena polymorpha]XP_052257282.1 uncharacterized protein LOC127862258 isoform X2 [Dreissena polymorpha]XP_052257283.1 uncharacterized protein LOC127862258 isoform X2 [Dreissena polymorpha]KAH3696002.1 hypothetical protein DPMN_083466 [Dreissena polymorpha]
MTNNNILHVFLVVVIVFINGAYGFEKRCYHNESDDADVFTLEMREQVSTGVAMQIMALNGASGMAPTNCTSLVLGSVNQLVIKYNTSSASQTTPNPSTNNCFVTYSAPIFSVKVTVQGNPGFVTITDRFYDVDCNTTSVDDNLQNLAGGNITNVLTFNEAVTRKDRVTMQLIKVDGTINGSPVKIPVLLGDRVRVRVTYTLDPAATAGEYPIGLHNYDLTVGPGSGASGRVQLITDTGCVPTTQSPFGLTRTFYHNRRLSYPRVPNQHVFETGPFKIVMFAKPTSKQLHFTLRYSAECYDDLEEKCFDQQATCDRRKKRAANEGGNTTLSLNIQVAMSGEAPLEQDVGSIKNLKAQECVTYETYWILAVVIGIVLLVVTMVTIYAFCRLRAEQQRSMVHEKSGH